MNGRYMMATTAHHKLGDISRDQPDLAWITGDDGDNWTGAWVTGFGYVNVSFPKATTRDLTDEERERYNGRQLAMGNRPVGRIDLGGDTETSCDDTSAGVRMSQKVAG